MNIINYDQTFEKHFSAMVADYFLQDLHSDIPEDIVRGKLMYIILGLWDRHTIQITLVLEGNAPIGFSIYQIDTPESDWCKRPGWGFIREFYVIPQYRNLGIGKKLANYTEQALRSMGAEHLYLTASGAIPFWQKCGWKLTDELCSNEQDILEK